ncbi:class I SAM-dependent methyltransferase [Nocardioides sp. DS6]|uniref:Class I SAM-dependent methyltransferase n=1 Tax=Nocardioides eburneus TaxID=3231482 RepID=A0ABV3T645_9ACTN
MASSDLVRTVDDDGILLDATEDTVVDVLVDDRRVWSFWSLRDTVDDEGLRRAPWPKALRKFLDGRARFTVRETVSGRVLFDDELAFGTSTAPIAIVGRHGEPLSLDKDGRLSATFDVRDASQTGPLLDAIEEVLGVLRELGVGAFPAYGTLLGAVREGNLLGHDSDADLGYVSTETTPVDVVRESFRLQREIGARGYRTHRYSGAAFKVEVAEGDGVVRGLDVFGGFFDDGRLYLMGEVGQEFREDWIFPLGTCTLADRTLPAPAVPEKLLEAMYGAGWRVPDPAFKFEKDPHTQAQLNGWFRGTQVDLRRWDRFYSGRRRKLPRGRASELAVLAHEELPADVHVLDVGAGRGRDAWYLARQGRTVTAYDYLPHAATAVRKQAEKKGLALDVRRLNLLEIRSVLGEGARVAHEPGQCAILAGHVLDATYAPGRQGFIRFARMALRGGGRLYASFWTGKAHDLNHVWPISVADVVSLIEQNGGSILHASESVVPRKSGAEVGVGRVVAQWA